MSNDDMPTVAVTRIMRNLATTRLSREQVAWILRLWFQGQFRSDEAPQLDEIHVVFNTPSPDQHFCIMSFMKDEPAEPVHWNATVRGTEPPASRDEMADLGELKALQDARRKPPTTAWDKLAGDDAPSHGPVVEETASAGRLYILVQPANRPNAMRRTMFTMPEGAEPASVVHAAQLNPLHVIETKVRTVDGERVWLIVTTGG